MPDYVDSFETLLGVSVLLGHPVFFKLYLLEHEQSIAIHNSANL